VPLNILPVTCISHREGSRSKTILGLDDLITTKLNPVDESIVLVIGNGDGGLDLAEKGYNGVAGVTANDGDGELLGIGFAGNLSNEGLSTDDIEGGDTEEALGVENALGLEDLGGDGDGRVDGVRDNEDESVGGNLGSNLNKALDDTGVDVEKIVTGHAGLTWKQPSSEFALADITHQGLKRYIRGMPAGMTMISASLKAALAPSSLGR
jgi:hypothetical protein